jgi:hypothetical protein
VINTAIEANDAWSRSDQRVADRVYTHPKVVGARAARSSHRNVELFVQIALD